MRKYLFYSISHKVLLILLDLKPHVLPIEVTKLSDLFPIRQYHLNSSTTSTTTDVHMDMYCGLPVDFSSFNLPRNGDFSQVSVLSIADIHINRICFIRHTMDCTTNFQGQKGGGGKY